MTKWRWQQASIGGRYYWCKWVWKTSCLLYILHLISLRSFFTNFLPNLILIILLHDHHVPYTLDLLGDRWNERWSVYSHSHTVIQPVIKIISRPPHQLGIRGGPFAEVSGIKWGLLKLTCKIRMLPVWKKLTHLLIKIVATVLINSRGLCPRSACFYPMLCTYGVSRLNWIPSQLDQVQTCRPRNSTRNQGALLSWVYT